MARPGGERTVIDVLERVAADYPDVEAYVEGSRRLTYFELAGAELRSGRLVARSGRRAR